jgi:ankyrin repeat protein
MRALVAAGANPALKAQDGSTLIMAAAASGHLEAVEYAFQLAPDITAAGTAGQTPLHAALTGTMQVSTPAEIGKVIRFLAEHGAELDLPDGTGRTPLDQARSGNTAAAELIEKLIRASGKEPRTRRGR